MSIINSLGSNDNPVSHNGHNDKLSGFQLTDSDYYLQLEDVSDEEGVPVELKNSPDYEELLWLKRIRREKELEQREGKQQPTKHFGYKCDGCSQDPILGGRFTCVDCARKEYSVDFCCECAPKASKLQNIGVDFDHRPDHILRPVRSRVNDISSLGKYMNNTRDKDYLIESNLGNYLDPNYQYFK